MDFGHPANDRSNFRKITHGGRKVQAYFRFSLGEASQKRLQKPLSRVLMGEGFGVRAYFSRVPTLTPGPSPMSTRERGDRKLR